MTLVDALLALGAVVVVPLGLAVAPRRSAVAPRYASLVALVAAASLVLDRPQAAALVVPWLTAAVIVAGHAALVWLRRSRQLRDLWWPVATAYLVVGAGWWLAHAAGLEPVGIAAPFVELTAVHFHYAGFTATVYAALTWRHVTQRSRTAAAGLVLVASAPPFVAVGFTWIGWLQIVGAVLLTVGLLVIAWVVLREIVPAVDDRSTAVLLAISALAVIVPMLLAVQWAVGANLGTPALSVPDMARTHGVANALGFSLLGLLGWHRLVSSRSGDEVRSQGPVTRHPQGAPVSRSGPLRRRGQPR